MPDTVFCNLRDNTLIPLQDYLFCNEGDDFFKISEININDYGEVWVDRWGQPYQERVVDNKLTKMALYDIVADVANFNDLPFDGTNHQIVAAQLPGGHRFQATLGGSVTKGVSISIRVKRPFEATFEDFNVTPEQQRQILKVIEQGGNIFVSGGTSTGKTTFLNILFRHIDPRKRIIIVEDTQELDPPHANQVRHIAKRFATGTGLGWEPKMDTVVRENPDVVGVGELSIFNAFPCINLMNLGNESFYCSSHANNPLEFLDGFRTRVMMAGHDASSVIDGLVRNIDLIIQLGRDGEKRVIKDMVNPQDLPWKTLVGGQELDNANDNRIERIHCPNVRRNLKSFHQSPEFKASTGYGGLREDEKLYIAAHK